MRTQIQRLPLQRLIRIAERGSLALAFALLVVMNTGAAQDPQSGQPSQSKQTRPAKKTKRPMRTLSDPEVLEARKLLDQLGYWVDLEATGKDASLRHALIAYQKIEG